MEKGRGISAPARTVASAEFALPDGCAATPFSRPQAPLSLEAVADVADDEQHDVDAAAIKRAQSAMKMGWFGGKALALPSISAIVFPMPVTLPLKDMTVSEKLQLMETLWEDLSRNADALESPEWHREVLEERERRIASGEAHFSDWEKAKDDIRKRVS